MVDTRDYDQFAGEADELDGPQVRIAGHTWTLPGRHQVSAKAVFDFQRLRAALARGVAAGELDDDDQVPDELLDGLEQANAVGMLRILVGRLADEMVAAGASHTSIERLARDAVEFYEQGSGPLSDALPPVNRAERRQAGKGSGGRTSQSAGSSSKPTSSGSTAST